MFPYKHSHKQLPKHTLAALQMPVSYHSRQGSRHRQAGKDTDPYSETTKRLAGVQTGGNQTQETGSELK